MWRVLYTIHHNTMHFNSVLSQHIDHFMMGTVQSPHLEIKWPTVFLVDWESSWYTALLGFNLTHNAPDINNGTKHRPLSFSFQQVCESREQLGGFWRMLLLGLGLWHCAGLDQSQARNNDSGFVFHRELRNGSVSATEHCCPVHCKVLGVNVDANMDGIKGYNINKGRISADRAKLRKCLGQILVCYLGIMW